MKNLIFTLAAGMISSMGLAATADTVVQKWNCDHVIAATDFDTTSYTARVDLHLRGREVFGAFVIGVNRGFESGGDAQSFVTLKAVNPVLAPGVYLGSDGRTTVDQVNLRVTTAMGWTYQCAIVP